MTNEGSVEVAPRASPASVHSVDVTFGVLVGVAAIYLFHLTASTTFAGDDWGLLEQSGSLRGIFEPYNDQVSVAIVTVYRLLPELFGMSYTAIRVAGVLFFVAIPVTFYMTTRRVAGTPLAAVAALSMLGLARLEIQPANLNHHLMLVGAIVCAYGLNCGRDLAVAAGLTLALGATSGGVLVVVACVGHHLCTRTPPRRWVAALGPTGLWLLWWLMFARGESSTFRATDVGLGETLRLALEVAATPFTAGPVLTPVLVVAFCGHAIWRLRQGLDSAANLLAWCAAASAWAVGLAHTRGARGIEPEVFGRYQLLALGIMLLTLVPRKPIGWPNPRWVPTAAVAILVVGLVRGASMRDSLDERAVRLEEAGQVAECLVATLDDQPNRGMGGAVFDLRPMEVRAILDRYGGWQGTPECQDSNR